MHTTLQSTRTLLIRCCTILCVIVFDMNYQNSDFGYRSKTH